MVRERLVGIVKELFSRWCEHYQEHGRLTEEDAQRIAKSVDERFLVGDAAPLDMKYVGCFRFAPTQEFLDRHQFAGIRSFGKRGRTAGCLNKKAKDRNILFLFATRELYEKIQKEESAD